jgi:hypothetical protein
VHSPLAPLYFERQDERVTLKGGARLELFAAESGIRANVVLLAAWPIDTPQNLPSAPASSAEAALREDTPVTSRDSLLELSGNISQHALIAANGTRFIVDSMLDARRMAFGYRQTGVVLRALRAGPDFRFQLTLRSPGISLQSATLESAGLSDALVALSQCAKARQ